jgi:DNA-binding CsgD family transcriptional regulator
MMVNAMIRDVWHALRSLMKSPGFALVFIATMGLGIGANTAIFSAVNGVLLRPLPHDQGDRLVYLRHSAALVGADNVLFSVPEIDDYRQGSPSLGAVAEFSAMTFTMLGYEGPRLVRAGIVTGNYFEVMGLEARIGRTIELGDDGAESASVVLLTDEYWRRVFLSDPEIIGRTVEINGTMADVEIVAAVQVGVRGIVLKDQSADELIDTIRGVARGEKRIAPELVQRALDAALFEDAITGPLSERETEVMRFAVRGMKNQGIAEAVGIREGTVKFHLHNVFKKLGVKNRVELAVRARESDLL